MTDLLYSPNGKLNALNRKIIQVKKKIQLSEGQRKANFEECDAKKRESIETISKLKREVKELQTEFAKTKNNEKIYEKAVALNRECAVFVGKRSLNDALADLDEHNIRLRKKLDLAKYQADRRQKQLQQLLREYEELMDIKPTQAEASRASNRLIKKIIVKLENQLHRVSVMQMEADTVRKKYQAVKANFKSGACLYASCLDELEKSIREQDNEIERLQKVKMEAIELRETTKETLTKQEIEAFQKSKERESVIQEYRKRVEDRKIELERLERLIFPSVQRQIVRGEDLDTGRKSPTLSSARGSETAPPQSEIDRLEEIFVKLRNATGVSQTSQVLDRFLAQRATREKLKRMQTSTEAEKVQLEKHRQQLTAEIEMLKFAETKDADQNADKLENLNKQIENQQKREKNAMDKQNEYQYLLEGVRTKLMLLCDKLQHENEIEKTNELPKTPMETLDLLNNRINKFVEKLGGPEKYNELVDQLLNDNKAEAMSLETTSEPTKHTGNEEQPLFTLFSSVSTPAAHQVQISEDEEDVPSRGLLKRQAQLLVDAKSRRKNFAFKR